MSSVSLGHAATNPEDRGSVIVITLRSRGVRDHLRDGSGHRVRGITSRLIFESRFDARDSRNPWEIRGLVIVTQTISSTS